MTLPPVRHGRIFRRLRRDERAVIAPVVAAFGTMLIGAAGFALDAAVYYAGNRDLRAATEAAALAAAIDPAAATTRAQAYLSRNGYDPSVLKSVEVGRYCANVHMAPEARFDTSYALCPGNGASTAVRIQTEAPSRQFLTRLLGPMDPIPALAASATAARIDEAGIGVTSGIINVTNSLVNDVNDLMGALLNVHLSLNAADIQALMSGNVDAGLFFDALARRVGETGTYDDLVARTVDLQDLMAAASEAAPAPATAAALQLLATQAGPGYQVPLPGLFGLGLFKDMPVGEADVKPALRAGLNAYQLWAFAVQNGSGKIDLSDAVSQVVAGSTVRITAMVRGPLNRPRFSFGPAGETSASTSALRLQLQLGLGNISILGSTLALNSVPVLLDVASAQADLTGIDCFETAEQATDTHVTVHATSGLVNAYIGNAPSNAMNPSMVPLSSGDFSAANLLNTNVAGLIKLAVTAHAAAGPIMGNSGNLTFGPGGQGTIGSPAQPGTAATIGNGSQVGPLISSLTSDLDLAVNVDVLGICLTCGTVEALVNNQIVSSLTATLGGLVGTTADPLLDNLLAALGVQLGHASVRVSGARCGVPVLV